MKKYLMIGFAAVAFAACSNHDFETMSQEEYDQYQIQQAYNKAFTQSLLDGKAIASNQDWGFSANSYTRAFTRSVDVNGNMWESRPAVTEKEANAIYAYVNRVKSSIPKGTYFEESPITMENFFVTQVWGGQSTDTNCLYLNGDQTVNASKGQEYQASDYILGSSKMNHLQISTSDARLGDGVAELDKTTWDHANNFNAGQNRDWDGNTMFVGWGTKNFAYHSTEDSKYHDKWIIVDGQYITDVDGNHYPGKYYVCFDFIATNPEAYTKFRAKFWNAEGNNGGEWYETNFNIPGVYSLESAKELTYTVTLRDTHKNENYTKTFTLIDGGEEGKSVKDIQIEGYDKGNWIVPANEIYTDWIVRLVEAQPKNDDLTKEIRIVAEDLSASGASDFDFNDVVLDVTFGNPAKVMLVAAGGTLQLKVGSTNGAGGVEVHEALLGAENAKKNEKIYKMVSPGGDVWPVEAVDITSYLSDTNIPDAAAANEKIRIEVYKQGASKEYSWNLLTAPRQEPASKLAVGKSFTILRERQSIKNEFEFFLDWATDANFTSKWW